mmetsp:Transcript_12090/g.38810  ORF Transcript_12090/g.38810 Transcript_12090/m.38810 type:complete len:952 (+) Transcript_12090:92-2947(+)
MSLALGDWVSVRGHEGQVRYFGATGFSEGMWAGIELQAAVGRNDGAVRGVRYFSCAPRHGLFVPASQCVKIDGPSDSGSGAPDLADAWVKVEGADEGAALKAGQESQKVIDYLTAQYPHGATPDKAPALKKERSSGGFFGGRSSSRARVKNQLSQGGDEAYATLLAEIDLPPDYAGPCFESRPTAADAAALLSHVKRHVAASEGSAAASSAAVPHRIAMQLLLWARQHFSNVGNVVDISIAQGRVVVVGDTHGQLADFCWLLRSHGPPTLENVYLINGDVADRGAHAVEIFLLIIAFLLAEPAAMHLNRGNHESLDMNVRGFHEGGGFATEVGAKYDSAMFTLFQDVFNLLPLATRVNSEVLVLHGGLSRTNSATLAQISAIDRRRPIPVAPVNAEDMLFFDLMWADPRAVDGVGLSAVRGAGCATFGPDITRRFCEINRLRMVIRSHEVPKSLSGVQVQHAGRLVTIFSASNYCGRIGNTGGTMLLTPALDYQLMEHWAPTVSELLVMEAEEEAEKAPSTPKENPSEKRKSFSAQANELMRADVLQKMKELVCEHKPALAQFYEQHAGGSDVITRETAIGGLREVVPTPLPWDDFLTELVGDAALLSDEDDAVRFRLFLGRYRVAHEQEGWQADLLSSLHDALTHKDLKSTLAFFDPNEDGVVTYEELVEVLVDHSMGIPEASLKALAATLLGQGQTQLPTSSLLARLHVTYRDVTAEAADAAAEVRQAPEWAEQLLATVARQCALRKRDSEQLFRSFDSNADGVVSYGEFQAAMLRLGGYEVDTLTDEQRASIEQMLLDLAAWVDQRKTGAIKYIDFIDAFRILEEPQDASTEAVPGAIRRRDSESLGLSLISQMMEQLCSLFYQHRWSLQRAFEYFDANGDGVLTPEEFGTALRALSELSKASDVSFSLDLDERQLGRLVQALDRDGDGLINYDEFLTALEMRDVMEL